MTAQEYYDELVYCAFSGEFPALDKAGNCAYLTEDGRRCAAGILIPEGHYRPPLEGCCVTCNDYPQQEEYFTSLLPAGLKIEDLRSTQLAHDQAHSNNWMVRYCFADQFLYKLNNLLWVNRLGINKIKVERRK